MYWLFRLYTTPESVLLAISILFKIRPSPNPDTKYGKNIKISFIFLYFQEKVIRRSVSRISWRVYIWIEWRVRCLKRKIWKVSLNFKDSLHHPVLELALFWIITDNLENIPEDHSIYVCGDTYIDELNSDTSV